MSRTLVTVASHTPVFRAERLAASKLVHHLLVLEAGLLVGVLCLCDLWNADRDAVASDLMASPPATIDCLAPLGEAADEMEDLAVGFLPVLDGGGLVGAITRGDLRRAGVAMENQALRICSACGSRHHVRCAEIGNIVAFCLECLERGRAFDDSDPYDELGGGG